MSEHLPVFLFLVPFVTAVSLPIVGAKHATWFRPLALGSVSLMSVLAILNVSVVSAHGEIRYAFGGWAVPLGIEWVDDGLAAVVILTISLLTLIALIYGEGDAGGWSTRRDAASPSAAPRACPRGPRA